MHTALVSRLLRDRSAWELVTLETEKAKVKSKTAPARQPSLVTA
jgi:UDP-3-O-[3-hydroxymyristoyl] N-acetylglucosamine deacetylase